jgi:hypothetical protein
VTVIVTPVPRFINAVAVADQVVALLGNVAVSTALSLFAPVIWTLPPPPRSLPGGHVAVAVICVLSGAFAAEVAVTALMKEPLVSPGEPGGP